MPFCAGGRVVAVGLPPEAMSLDIPRLVLDGIEVVGSLGRHPSGSGGSLSVCRRRQSGAESHPAGPLEDINAIFKEMEQGQIRGRMVIDLRS